MATAVLLVACCITYLLAITVQVLGSWGECAEVEGWPPYTKPNRYQIENGVPTDQSSRKDSLVVIHT